MSPELFIKKHITDALLREGFTAEVARGGLISGWITIAVCHRPVVRGKHLMTVFTMPASGCWDRQRKQNDGQRKSREEVRLPACSDTRFEFIGG